ncbi:leader peptidase (prepilin peptidase)/N-methyltransferase [Sphingomonas sp. BE123]|jgi:leader peptidase (prepilin peptidase)/N-methyltransferase|uniref:prepilin peptidase n=1 Tax=unclassified Sphingomonas TaxID=196159 RepID=UPI00286722FC|nr:prepilin peptidase [Sphingomonas sp. BE123]MDR6852001.1 leader peptidase (prepilin peptidase)/N-methyltransferase [Sphingomonas sp. BE123]
MAELYWPTLLGILGAVFGSFIATVAIRWPQGRSALQGRSACDGCGKPLAAHELIPLVSFLLQRGRCRACGNAIPRAHPATEIAGAVIGVAAGLVAPGWEGVAGAVFGWLLLALAALDLAAFWLPNLLTGALAAAGLVDGIFFEPGWIDRLLGGLIGFGLLYLVAFSYRHVRKREGLGGGDPKLFGAIGLWLGASMLAPVLLGASVTGLAVALVMKLSGREIGMTSRLPLGTLLAIAAFPAWLYSVGV